MNNTIPFGKYKGQPFDVLNNDPNYLAWLKTQSWFNDRFANFNTLIVNNIGENSCTPEHNRLQARFIDKDFCLMFLRKIYGGYRMPVEKNYFFWQKLPIARKSIGYRDLPIPSLKSISFVSNPYSYKPTTGKTLEEKFCEKELCTQSFAKNVMFVKQNLYIKSMTEIKVKHVDFEKENIDVSIITNVMPPLKLELKPNVSDDYPAILRQMIKNGAYLLVSESFDASGANIEQVKAIFRSQHKMFVTLNDLGL